jgi:hypothetical protein
MSIRELIAGTDKARTDTRTAGAWRVQKCANIATLWHYGTRMLTWNVNDPRDPDYLDYSLGWGSVSDQNGMNTAFRILDIPLYFSRAGGACIT